GQHTHGTGGAAGHGSLPYLKAQPLGTPSLANSFAAGQKPVKADCSRFRPTNAVSNCHHGEKKCASARLTRIITPAKAKMARSRFMSVLLLGNAVDRGNPPRPAAITKLALTYIRVN